MNKPKLDKKALKYSSASIILAAVFIVFVFAINYVITTVTNRFNLFVDLTEEELYEISDESIALLENMGDEEIKFIFFTPLDELDNNEYIKSIKTLALEYQEKYDNISIEYVDMLKNPGAVAKYRKEYDLKDTTVIVESAKRFVAFDMSECFVYQENNGSYIYYAFNAEYRFTSALLRVMRENMPKAIFTSNHLETVPTQFKALLQESGFDVAFLDLAQNDIPDDTELIIINDPRTDITGIESETQGISETTKLARYLEKGGNLMLFVDPQTPQLNNLDELCATWGMKVEHGYTVLDDRNSISSGGSSAVIARYAVEDEKLALFHSKLSAEENPQKTVLLDTAPITLLPLTDVKNSVGTILTSYATAYVPITSTESYMSGIIPLLAAGYRTEFDSELGESVYNYFVVGGSTWFTSDQFLASFQNTYGNYELVKNMIAEITDETMILNIRYKVYNDTTLTIDNATSQKWLMALVVALPIVVLLAAMAVFLKRRHL